MGQLATTGMNANHRQGNGGYPVDQKVRTVTQNPVVAGI